MSGNGNSTMSSNKKRLRIALSSLPYSGHLNPLVILAEALAARESKGENGARNEVFIVTLPFGMKDIESRCNDLGIQLVGLKGNGFDSLEAIKAWSEPKLVFPGTADHLKSAFEEALESIQPDVIVSDFCDFGSQRYAALRNIPLVINWPGPVSTVHELTGPVINGGTGEFYFASGGLYISYVGMNIFRFLASFNVADFGKLTEYIQKSVTCGNSMVLVHSFWGLEKTKYLLHPNIVPVGPIEKVQSKTQDFSQSHPELHSFLHTARDSERKILLVSTGTVLDLEEWMVFLFWEAFEKLSRESNVSIVWSLKEAQQQFLSKDQLQHPDFHFSSWLPQPALLASDLVDGMFTHCGWNGTTECILGGKPTVVMPFFADQTTNAKLLLEAGCATSVAAIPTFNMDSSGHSSYTKANNDDLGWFDLKERFRRMSKSKVTVAGMVEACQMLLTDPSYTRSAQQLQALSSGPGKGRDFACDLIEHAGHHGLRHLSDSEHTITNGPGAGTHSRRLTGHRPLLVTLAMGTAAGWALMTTYAIATKQLGR